MGWSLWEVFTSVFRRDNEDEEAEANRFVPSPLDLSIRYSNGGSDHEKERELAEIEAEAQELEEHRREHQDN